jgi:hypothetical protein
MRFIGRLFRDKETLFRNPVLLNIIYCLKLTISQYIFCGFVLELKSGIDDNETGVH